MLNKLVMAGIVAGAFAAVPVLLERMAGGADDAAREEARTLALDRPEAEAARIGTPAGRKVRLSADGRGHFNAAFALNGRRVGALVDTGASVVAINESTARRIGLKLAASDFSAAVETANGRARAAMVRIDSVSIGRIEVRDVQAVVLEDAALSGTLIGMSFLSELRRFGVEDGVLMLEQ
jgi:aspartyl protease family protein